MINDFIEKATFPCEAYFILTKQQGGTVIHILLKKTIVLLQSRRLDNVN